MLNNGLGLLRGAPMLRARSCVRTLGRSCVSGFCLQGQTLIDQVGLGGRFLLLELPK